MADCYDCGNYGRSTCFECHADKRSPEQIELDNRAEEARKEQDRLWEIKYREDMRHHEEQFRSQVKEFCKLPSDHLETGPEWEKCVSIYKDHVATKVAELRKVQITSDAEKLRGTLAKEIGISPEVDEATFRIVLKPFLKNNILNSWSSQYNEHDEPWERYVFPIVAIIFYMFMLMGSAIFSGSTEFTHQTKPIDLILYGGTPILILSLLGWFVRRVMVSSRYIKVRMANEYIHLKSLI